MPSRRSAVAQRRPARQIYSGVTPARFRCGTLQTFVPMTLVSLPNPVALEAPELYINRELSWLAFNTRVLTQATDHRQPLLERVKFLAIVGSNLDEFFMIRVATLLKQLRTRGE